MPFVTRRLSRSRITCQRTRVRARTCRLLPNVIDTIDRDRRRKEVLVARERSRSCVESRVIRPSRRGEFLGSQTPGVGSRNETGKRERSVSETHVSVDSLSDALSRRTSAAATGQHPSFVRNVRYRPMPMYAMRAFRVRACARETTSPACSGANVTPGTKRNTGDADKRPITSTDGCASMVG